MRRARLRSIRDLLSGRALLAAHCTLVGLVLFAFGFGPATQAWHETQVSTASAEAVPASEFARMVREFSEEDGFFRSDNFISNETSYLHVVDKMHDLDASGGAYIGVGPEQNFTYIAKVRPQIAFIVDIRRQAIIQHLLFKALFHLADDRSRFLSLLFSKPLPEKTPPAEAGIDKVLDAFAGPSGDEEAFQANLLKIRKVIEQDFQLPLSARDQGSLEYVYGAFRDENLNIQYRTGGTNWGSPQWSRFPTLKDLILTPDLKGKLGNYLVSEDDYRFVRDLQRRNRVIPVVGDFAGPKALPAIGEYLRRNGYGLTVFYTSNVEQYLFASGSFGAFAENVRKLPVTERSLFIRAFPNMRDSHPAQVNGHRLTTLLQKMQVFLRDFDQGLYEDYWKLVTLNYIAAETP